MTGNRRPDGDRWHRPRPRLRSAIVASLLVVVSVAIVAPPPARAWGFVAHFIITGAAIDALPPALRGFFAAHEDFVVRHSIDPDMWRWDDVDWDTVCAPERGPEVLAGDERPRHFLDADAIAPYPFGDIPRDWAKYRELAGDEIESWGTAPWTVAAYTSLLSESMSEPEPDLHTLLCRGAILAHYVADLAQPLHLTVNYDGQLSGLGGIHSRFERHMVEYYEEALRARVRDSAPQAAILEDPVAAAFEMFVDGYPAVHAVLRADLLAQRARPLDVDDRGGDDPAYIRALWEQSGEIAAQRMAYGAEKVASYWTTAWIMAGRPDLLEVSDRR